MQNTTNNTLLPYSSSEIIFDEMQKINPVNLPLKIETYHFFKKKIDNPTSDFNKIDLKNLYNTLHQLSLPEDKTFFLTIKNNEIIGLNQALQKFLFVDTQNFSDPNTQKILTLNFNVVEFFKHSSNLNLVIIEMDFQGTIEFKASGGERCANPNPFENSLNILHYQIHQQSKKSLTVFNFENINNNPISYSNNSKENHPLPVFLNYYNLSSLKTSNYQDINFVFNLSVPSNITFFQSEQSNTLMKNNVMINTLSNPFHKEESKINVNYFHCLSNHQWRDDAFEINHLIPRFHSVINYFVLNKGTAASQVNTFISPNAPDSKSHQHLKHVLLEDSAKSFSKPNLMIENPNVESSHGNSMGGLNPEHLIYLQQRGINSDNAKKILAISAIDNHTETNYFSSIIKAYFKGQLL